MTTARTALLGLIGWPVEHSRSPAIHGAALEALGVDARYLAFAVPERELGAALAGLRALGARGVNVTVPHKRAVIAHLDELDDDARVIGAVNTVAIEGGRLVGANTDAAGFVRALVDAGHDPAGRRALVVGAGGAARAAVAGLARAGAARIEVAARRPAEAERIARELSALAPVEASELGRARGHTVELLVQATSAPMGRDADAFADALPWGRLPGDAVVMDLVYAPLETSVLRAARGRGLRTVDGLGALVHQAALSLERWLGVRPPIDVMREAAAYDPADSAT